MSQEQPKSSPLPAYRINCECGYAWSTSMASWVTLQDAEDYFIGNEFNVGGAAVGRPELEDWKVKPVKVERLR